MEKTFNNQHSTSNIERRERRAGKGRKADRGNLKPNRKSKMCLTRITGICTNDEIDLTAENTKSRGTLYQALMQIARPSCFRLWLELLLVFCLLPLVCWLANLPILLVLLAACALVVALIARDPTFDRRCFWSFPAGTGNRIWRRIFLVWLGALPLLAGLAWLLQPDSLFEMPLHRTKLWLLVMFAYPLLSVVPQEIIYRAFFCHRYAPLFGNGARMALASAIAFGFAHIVFGNGVAVALTLAGGWLFARTFLQTRSLPCVALQHALFGGAIFTVGLGRYFFHGTTKFMETLVNHFSQ